MEFLKREKATNYSVPDVTSISAQLYNYKKALANKLNLEFHKGIKAEEIITYFICGEKAYSKIDDDDKRKLEKEGVIIRSYDQLIRTAKQIYAVNFGEDVDTI